MYFFLGICQNIIGNKLILDYFIPQIKFARLLEVPVNAGVVKNKVRLYEWRMGSAELIWSDRVKLWVACNYLQYSPEKLVIVICAFSGDRNGLVTKTHWNERDYNAIEGELKLLLAEDTSKATSNPSEYPDYVFNIDVIEEIQI